MLKLANNATSRLSASIASDAATLTLLPGDGAKFPALDVGDWFPLTLVKANGTLEITRCTARAVDTLTIERAKEGTTAKAFDAGDRAESRLTVQVIEGLYADFAALSEALTLQAAGKLDSNGGTATNLLLVGGVTEDVYALSGTAPALDPKNGSIQTWTLAANSSPTDAISTGQSIALLVNDGTSYSITWPSIKWVGGTAPSLAATGYTVFVLWKIAGQLYGTKSGEVA